MMEIDEAINLEKMDTEDTDTVGEIVFDKSPDPLLSTKCDLYRGSIKKSPKKVVVKKIEDKGFENGQEIERELHAASLAEEDINVLKLERYEHKGSMWFLAYQNFDYSLDNLVLGNVEQVSDMTITKILYSATKGLRKLHDSEIVHRNIRPENIVIFRKEGKIAYHDLSKMISNGKNCSTSRDFSENDYSAPELLKNYKHNRANQKKATGSTQKKKIADGFKVDVFSMGIVYFYALTGCHLFERYGKETKNNILKKNFDHNFKSLDSLKNLDPWKIPLAKQLIEAMVQYEPKNRPTVQQVLNHPFFWNNDQMEQFLKIASQYILGCDDFDKEKVSSKIVPGTETWDKDLEQGIRDHLAKYGNKSNKKVTLQQEVYIDPATEFLKQLRNLPEHIREKKNEGLSERFDHLTGGILEYFLTRHPESLSNFYECFVEFSSYKFLKKFYCDCFLSNPLEYHKCANESEFRPYDWMNFMQMKK